VCVGCGRIWRHFPCTSTGPTKLSFSRVLSVSQAFRREPLGRRRTFLCRGHCWLRGVSHGSDTFFRIENKHEVLYVVDSPAWQSVSTSRSGCSPGHPERSWVVPRSWSGGAARGAPRVNRACSVVNRQGATVGLDAPCRAFQTSYPCPTSAAGSQGVVLIQKRKSLQDGRS